jgi:hypothetical protein
MEETVKGRAPHDVVADELAKYPMLTQSGRDHLSMTWAGLGRMTSGERAEQIAKRMQSGLAKNFINPEYVDPPLASGGEKSPIRKALEMEQDRLKPGELEGLIDEIGGRAARMSWPKVRRLVVEHLDRRDSSGKPRGFPATRDPGVNQETERPPTKPASRPRKMGL